MDRLCARIALLLVSEVLISYTLQEEQLNVHLEPNIQVCEGESVTLNCTFQPGGKYKVKLYYSPTPDFDCNSPRVRTSEKWRITENNKTWSTFNISSIKTVDSGWYFCKVTRDIPFLEQKCSDGIRVLVDANRSPENPNQPDNQTDNQTQNPTTEDKPTTCTTSELITGSQLTLDSGVQKSETTSENASATTTLPPSSDPPRHIRWWIWLALAVGCVVLVVSIVVIYILTRKTTEIIYENTKPVESGCCRRNRNQMEISNLAASKKTETIKPLRKYDTLSSNRNRRS